NGINTDRLSTLLKSKMLKKGSKLYSILRFKCPQCQEGNFLQTHPYSITKAGKNHSSCPECGCNFSPEPGFYYGAMYVSYAIGVAMFVAVFVLIYLLFPNAPAWLYVSVLIAIMVILGPFLYSLSKIIWANMFIAYKGKS